MSSLRERMERTLHTPTYSSEDTSQAQYERDTPSVDVNTSQRVKVSKPRYKPVTKTNRQGLSKSVKEFRDRLQAGSRWLTWHHQARLDDNPRAESDDRFIAALDLWSAMEGNLRELFGYEGCIFGPGESCPEDTPVTCDACIKE